MTHITAIVVAFKTLTLVLGGLITYFAYQAYSRTNSKSLKALTIGFGFVTVGALVAGAVDQLTGLDQAWALVAESALTTIGFAVIVYSLYSE